MLDSALALLLVRVLRADVLLEIAVFAEALLAPRALVVLALLVNGADVLLEIAALAKAHADGRLEEP